MLKKLSVLALAIVMILSVMIPLVSADKASTLGLAATADVAAGEAGIITIKSGDIIRITFATTKNTGLYSLQFDIVYDADVIDVVGKAIDGSITVEQPAEILTGIYSPDHFSTGNKTAFKEVEPGKIRFTMVFGQVTEYVGDLFTILFKVSKIEHAETVVKFDNVKAYTSGTSAAKLSSGDIETNQIALLGHEIGKAQVVAPTCVDGGYSYVKCSGCEYVYKFDETAALGHDEVVDEAVDPTTFGEGKTEGKHCARCGEVLVAQETIPALGIASAWWFWLIIVLVVVAIIAVVCVVVLKKKKAGKEA